MLHNQRLPFAFICVMAAGIFLTAHFALLVFLPGWGAVISNGLALAADAASAAALGYTARRIRPLSRRLGLAWGALGLAMLAALTGDAYLLAAGMFSGLGAQPSQAHAVILLYYPLFLVGVLMFPAREESGYEWVKKAIDMVIVLLAAVVGLWNFLLGPVYKSGAEPGLLLTLQLAHPIGGMILMAALLMVVFKPAGLASGAPIWLLAAGSLLRTAFDLLFAYQLALGRDMGGSLAGIIAAAGTLCIGLAGAFQVENIRRAAAGELPAAVNLPEADLPAGGGESAAHSRSRPRWMMFLPYAWIAGAYVLLAVRGLSGLPMTRHDIGISIAAMIALVVLRQVVVLSENWALSRDLQRALDQVRQQKVALERANDAMQDEIRERQRAEERLTYDALHDALTGLPNRALFLDRLGQAGRKRRRSADYRYAVLFLDLDSFKVINDSLGHITGDQLLVRTAQILQGCVRGTDTVARLGGDEFVVLVEDLSSEDDVLSTADRLQEELSRPMQLDSARVVITVSIGIVQHVDEYDLPEDVLRDADLAMYQAKLHGKARYEIFHANMRASAITRMALENDLRRALENDEFVLHYQPILDLPERHLVGFEALVRWNHPTRGLIPPAEFIPVAEETGLILPLGRWILYEACRQARAWQDRYPDAPLMRVSVNISGRQLKQADFVDTVAQALADTRLAPESLALEVTESVCLDNLDLLAVTLEALRSLGVETQIDDFGKGYSSLSYLQRLPVRAIKIDRSFIQAITLAEPAGLPPVTAPARPHKNGKAHALPAAVECLARAETPDIVRAIFSLVNELGITAVAEGIESEVQIEALNRLHCSFVQGFLLARPMDAQHADVWLAAQRARA